MLYQSPLERENQPHRCISHILRSIFRVIRESDSRSLKTRQVDLVVAYPITDDDLAVRQLIDRVDADGGCPDKERVQRW